MQQLKEEAEEAHVQKLLTLISYKIDEKFQMMSKAFLFFDFNHDKAVSRQEFHKGIERMRVKLSTQDIDLVFDYLD